MRGAHDARTLLGRVRDRVPFDGHDGRSGASLERGVLDTGERVIVKTVVPDRDVTFVIGGDRSGRERQLWAAGVLEELPPGTGHAILAAGWDRERLITIMRDLGDAVLTWDRRLSAAELQRIFAALGAMHRRFVADAPDGLCDLARRVSLFAPDRFAALVGGHPLAAQVLAGWEHFVDQVPGDVSMVVLETLQQPDGLAARLTSGPLTLCHGDSWLVNMAVTAEEVVLLDWNLATAAPASLDLIDFVVGCAANVDLPLDAILARARAACADLVDDSVWNGTVFWAVCELGWNKALDAATHPDVDTRARAGRELAWWVKQADHALSRL